MDYTIVPMDESHIPQVEEIERTCFPDPWSRKLLEDLLRDERTVSLAAVGGDGAVLGYVSLSWVLDEGYLNNIAVRPACRRQGVAGALLEDLHRTAEEKGLSFLLLMVRASNLPAQSLYAKHGYTEAGRRKNYYLRPREDAIYMKLELTK